MSMISLADEQMVKAQTLVGDHGYAAHAFYDWIIAQDTNPVIPSHQRIKEARDYVK